MMKGKFTLGAMSLSLLILAGCSDAEVSAEDTPVATEQTERKTHAQTVEEGRAKAREILRNVPRNAHPEPEPTLKASKEFPLLDPSDRSEYVELTFPNYLMLMYLNTGWTEHSITALNSLQNPRDENYLNGLPVTANEAMSTQNAFEKREAEQKFEQQLEEELTKYKGVLVRLDQGSVGIYGPPLQEYDFEKEGFAWVGNLFHPDANYKATATYNHQYHFVGINAADFSFYPVSDVDKAKKIEAMRQNDLEMVVYGQVVRMLDDSSSRNAKYTLEIVPHHVDFVNRETQEVVLTKSI